MESLYVDNQLIIKNNIIEKLFWGKCEVEFAGSICNFIKGETIQKVIHNFKYKRFKNLAFEMGCLMGKQLITTNTLITPDYVICVPTSLKKKINRGYNQSEILAKGVASEINVSFLKSVLKKIKNIESQTDKNVSGRYDNINNSIIVNQSIIEKINGKHLLIVDDVITTGATLVSCVKAINEVTNCKISVLSLAYRNI